MSNLTRNAIDLRTDEEKRIAAGRDLAEIYHAVTEIAPYEYLVVSQFVPNKFYHVKADPITHKLTCDCPDRVYRGVTCKHEYAVGIVFPQRSA